MAPHPDDDPSIDDGCRLFRRLTTHQVKTEPEGVRISSAALQCSSDGSGTSVHLEDELAVALEELVAHRAEPTWLGSLRAREVRDEALGVTRVPDAIEPAHGEIVGKRSGGTRRRLARLMRWEIPHPDAIHHQVE